MSKDLCQAADMSTRGKLPKCRIVILDDQPLSCEGVKRLLGQYPPLEVVGIFDRKAPAFDFIRANQPDLLLLELNLRRDIGLEVLKDAHAEFDDLRVVAFTDLDEMVYGERAMLAGARGYLMKTSPSDMLLQVIGTVMREDIFLSEQLMSFLLKRMYLGSRSNLANQANPIASLSDREFEVFEMIGRGKGTREIAGLLSLSIKTVENHREKLKKKLGMPSGSSLVHYATVWMQEQSNKNNNLEADGANFPAPKSNSAPLVLVPMEDGKKSG